MARSKAASANRAEGRHIDCPSSPQPESTRSPRGWLARSLLGQPILESCLRQMSVVARLSWDFRDEWGAGPANWAGTSSEDDLPGQLPRFVRIVRRGAGVCWQPERVPAVWPSRNRFWTRSPRPYGDGLQHARRVRGDAVGQGVDRVALPPAVEAPHSHPERRVPLEGALHRLADSLIRLAIARCS